MNSIFNALRFLANLQRSDLNQEQLKQVITDKYQENQAIFDNLQNICKELLLTKPIKIKHITDPSVLPLIVFDGDNWGVIKDFNSKKQWVAQFNNDEIVLDNFNALQIFAIKMKQKLDLGKSATFQMVKIQLLKHKKILIDAFIAGVFINIVAVVSAFYSMQIYDRVVPTGAKQTLLVLTIGVIVIIILEFISKLVRSNLYEKLIDIVDEKLAHNVYQRFLSLRLDQLPKSVGTLSGQMRGYESVRGFLSSITTYFSGRCAICTFLCIFNIFNWWIFSIYTSDIFYFSYINWFIFS